MLKKLYPLKKSLQGFSLVELSIVLVIVGVIVAGVVIGKDLIHHMKLKSVIKDIGAFRSAIVTYKEYYGYLPGDMPDADKYWPAIDSNCITHSNGNWKVDNSRERLCFFDMLSRSGAIKETYEYSVNTFPTAPFLDAAYYPIGGTSGTIRLGGQKGVTLHRNKIFTPYEAEFVDRKMDDAKPRDGKVYSINSYLETGCHTGSGQLWTSVYRPTWEYKLENDFIICYMDFFDILQ